MSISYFFRGNLPPSVTSLTATPTSVVSGSNVTFTSAALDLDGSVASVEYFLDGASKGISTSAGTNFPLTFVATTVGARVPQAQATDNLGIRSALFTGANLSVTGANMVPAMVTGLTSSTATTTALPLTATAPPNGGSAITDYVWQFRLQGATTFNTFADGLSAVPSTTVTGLLSGNAYEFQAAAVNSVGQGAYSATYTAFTQPDAPAAGTNTGSGSTNAFTTSQASY